MKFLGLRRFSGTSGDDVARYIGGDLFKAFQDLAAGLGKMSFADNFNSFAFQVTIASGVTLQIPNRLGTTAVFWFPVRITGDNRLVEDAAAPFTKDVLPIKNASGTATTATILFVRQ